MPLSITATEPSKSWVSYSLTSSKSSRRFREDGCQNGAPVSLEKLSLPTFEHIRPRLASSLRRFVDERTLRALASFIFFFFFFFLFFFSSAPRRAPFTSFPARPPALPRPRLFAPPPLPPPASRSYAPRSRGGRSSARGGGGREYRRGEKKEKQKQKKQKKGSGGGDAVI